MKKYAKNSIVGLGVIVVLAASTMFVRAQEAVTVLEGAALTRVVPTGFYFEGLSAPTQMRNAAAARFGEKRYLIAALVDTSGYAADVRAKYEGFFITDSPIQINGTYLNVRDDSTGGPYEILLGTDGSGGIVSTMTNHDLQLRSGVVAERGFRADSLGVVRVPVTHRGIWFVKFIHMSAVSDTVDSGVANRCAAIRIAFARISAAATRQAPPVMTAVPLAPVPRPRRFHWPRFRPRLRIASPPKSRSSTACSAEAWFPARSCSSEGRRASARAR